MFSGDSGARSIDVRSSFVLVDRRPSTASSAASNGAGVFTNGYFYGVPWKLFRSRRLTLGAGRCVLRLAVSALPLRC